MGWECIKGKHMWGYFQASAHDPLAQRALGWVERLSPSCYQGSDGSGEWVRSLYIEECKELVEATLRLKGIIE